MKKHYPLHSFIFMSYILCCPTSSFAEKISTLGPDAAKTKIMKRKGSYRNIILSVLGKSIVDDLNSYRPNCGSTVKEIYAQGNTLYSKVIDEATIRLSDFPLNTGTWHSDFSHFTPSENFMNSFNTSHEKLVSNVIYEGMFTYIRGRDSIGHGNWLRQFFVSEDPETIRFWAPYEIKFDMNPDARLVQLQDPNMLKISSGTKFIHPRDLWIWALDEIGSKYPEVKRACGTKLELDMHDSYGWIHYSPLSFIIAEDSGVDVIEYLQGGRWFMVLSPNAFSGARPNGETGGNRRHTPTGRYANPTVDASLIDTPLISVLSAQVGEKDVKKQAASFANGKISVTYSVDAKYLGLDKMDLLDNDFSISWKCFKGGRPEDPMTNVKIMTIPKDSQNKKFLMDCSL